MTAKSTRDHLIDVGVGLMHQKGFNATGLSDILQAADVPKGSFYHYFSSKEDFAAASLERYGMRERAHAAAVLGDTATPPLKRLRRYFGDLMKIYGQKASIPGCMMGRFSLEIAEESPQLRKRVSASFGHWQHTIAKVLEQAVAERELPAGADSESLAGFLLNSWEGALLRAQSEKSDAPLEIFLHYAFDVLLSKHSKFNSNQKRRAIG
jgi:TetR/AcrR family transcriptional repressor of nem operon